MIRIVTFYHEVSCIFIYGVVYGTNEEHTCSASYHCIIMHFAQHLWMSPSYGRDRTGTASYVARGGVRCSFIPCWVWRQWTCHMHYICIHSDLYIEALDIFLDVDIRFYVFMVEVCLFISYEVGCLKCYTSPLKLLSNEPAL